MVTESLGPIKPTTAAAADTVAAAGGVDGRAVAPTHLTSRHDIECLVAALLALYAVASIHGDSVRIIERIESHCSTSAA